MSGPGGKEQWQTVQDSFYDGAEKHTHLAFDPGSTYAKDITGHLERTLALRPSDRVLEIGAGAGRFTLHLAPLCGPLVALDTSQPLLDALQKELPPGSTVSAACASAFDLPGQLGTFDAICGFFILHHLPDHERLFRLIHAALKPGGRVAFVEPNRLNPSFLLQVMFSSEMQWEAEKGMFTFSARATRNILRTAGFSSITVKRFGLMPPQVLDRLPSMLPAQHALERIPLLRRVLPFSLIAAVRD